MSLPDDGAARFGEVRQGTPADEAGLRAGDQVVAVDGEPIDSGDELRATIDSHQPGDKITVTIRRDGREREVEVTLGARPATAQ